MMKQMSEEMRQCIEDCARCAAVCAHTSHHCLGLGGEHASPEHQGLLHDCTQICGVSVAFMARLSPHASHLCRECAEICTACADDCERLASGDDVMTRCAETCRTCAQSCERMAAAGVGR